MKRVLVANRGEIARRIIRACRERGLEVVAVYSEADAGALHVREADHAIAIGAPPPRDSYLRRDALLDAMKRGGCDALHPGYGFLSEDPALADAVRETGACFIGPSGDAIRQMGHKERARAIMRDAGVPIVPGSDLLRDSEDAIRAADAIGYPVMIKAASGGGGIGMMPCADAAALAKAFPAAARRAEAAFSDGDLYLERLVEGARHIEIQIAADAQGQICHLFERECSLQRRHQKVLEEAPSPALDPALRTALGEAAIRAARAIDYENVGTVEFLLGRDGGFYFMEMNTRLQVEHPVTEMTTGVDLVHLQLDLAAGRPLAFAQSDLVQRGHAIEMRLYAENPDKNFFPSPGTIETLVWPDDPNVRIDSGVESGTVVTPFYDPLLAKMIVRGDDRLAAIDAAARAIASTRIEGIHTNLAMHAAILDDPAFRRGEITTETLSELWARRT